MKEMRLLFFIVLLLCPDWMSAQNSADSPELSKAKAELERLERLFAEGGVPRNKLEQARDAIGEAEDEAVLRRILFGSLRLENLTEPLTKQMLDAGKRLLAKQEARVEEHKRLVAAGVQSTLSLTPLLEELDSRKKNVLLAENRAELWNQLAEMAHAEQQRQVDAEQANAALQASDEDSENGIPSGRIHQLEREFEKVFSKPLPVSARGDTSFHRTLGFNHTGRVDVGVSPDSAEGQWLVNWLERVHVPYIAFRSAVKGQSSAPHVHVGPPSSRLRVTD